MLITEPTIDLKDHPILITLQDTVSGDGFLARITVSGRTLMRQEEDGKWWMYGVRPAAIAESGGTVDEAFLRFRQAHTQVLLDMVQESKSFDEFRTEVERFFNESDVDEQAWEEPLRLCGIGASHRLKHLPNCRANLRIRGQLESKLNAWTAKSSHSRQATTCRSHIL